MAPSVTKAKKADEEEEVKWDEIYKTEIILDENNKPVPQWGFMKDNIEKKYEPVEVDISAFFSWNFTLYLINAIIMMLMTILTKFTLNYCSHPAQAFFLKSVLLFGITFYL